MRSRFALAFALLAVFDTSAACKKEPESPQAPSAQEEPAPDGRAAPAREATAAGATPTSGDASSALAALIEPYESCRRLLAADEVDGVSSCADDIGKAAKAASGGAPAAVRNTLSALTEAAQALAGETHIEQARLRFGAVSERVVALVAAAPGASGYHVFECPMAKGYKRWVQREPAMANPYMGTKMLQCGSKVDLAQAAAHGADEAAHAEH